MKPEPVYATIISELRQLLDRGVYEPGDKFLTERDIAARYQTSRITANKVLSALVAEGLLEYRLGIGTFVKPRQVDYDLRSFASFEALCEQADRTPRTEVLAFESGRTSDFAGHVRQSLDAGANDKLYRMVRVRYANDVPVIYEERFLLAGFCPGITAADVETSVFELLESRFGLALYGVEQVISAESASQEVASALELPEGTALIEVKAVGYSDSETPLWLERALYRPDHYAFYNWLGPIRQTQPAEGRLMP